MNNKEIMNLLTSAEYKAEEDIKTYAKACVRLNLVRGIDGHLTINMKTMFDIVNYIIQGNNPEVMSLIRDYYKRSDGSKLGNLLSGFKFNKGWRKLQSEWGMLAPYLKVFSNGMYFPFNEELLETCQELIEENFTDASFRGVMEKYKGIPYAKILEAIREELSVAE